MGRSYHICPLDPGLPRSIAAFYRIDLDVLAAAIERRWPGSVRQRIGDPSAEIVFSWETPGDHHSCYCVIPRGQNSMWIEGGWGVRDVATVAVWFRKLVPPAYRLVLFDPDESPVEFELAPTVSETEVASFLYELQPNA